MNPILHKIQIQKTARYYTLGDRTEKTENIWFVCHGYGQLASHFIRKFDGIADEENLVIAPEGFHRYYLDEKHERTGASWMTRDDRLDDIDDYVAMLDRIHDEVAESFEGKIILLGFSQGVATVARWYGMGKVKAHHLILWAGVFPPDLPLEKEHWNFDRSHNHLVIGNKDEYFDEDRKEKVLSEIREKGIKFDYYTFDGGHTIDRETLNHIKNKL